MKGLKKTTIQYNKKWHNLTEDTRCHLDPDINSGVIKRKLGWKGLFGQIDNAQSHLEKKKVKEGDLFLFFGWFKQTVIVNENITFDSSAPDLHIIFGYLQIDKKVEVNSGTNVCEWMDYHPHANEERRENPKNTIYVAKDRLTLNNGIPGFGIFKFNGKPLEEYGLVLTKENCSRSKWNLPSFFKDEHVKISYHSQNSWRGGYFQSANGRGRQEFVVEENHRVEEWAKKLIEKNIID